MESMYKSEYHRRVCVGLIRFMLLFISGVGWSQIPTCGPNQMLTGYFVGAGSAAINSGTVTPSASNAQGAPDGLFSVMAATSVMTLDMGAIRAAGTSLNITYKSADANAPLWVWIATTSGGTYTNITQLAATTTTTTKTILLPLDAQFVRLESKATSYSIDAITYPIYKCVNSPAPTCSSGQTLVSYPTGAPLVTFTGAVTNSSNAQGVPDGSYVTLSNGTTLTMDFGSTVVAGNTLSFAYYSQYGSGTATPMQLWIGTSTSALTNVGTVTPSTTAATFDFVLPLDARYVQLIPIGSNGTYYIDAATYLKYACVTPPNTACSSGQQSVFYNQGLQGVADKTSSVTNETNVSGAVDGKLAGMPVNTYLTADFGDLINAGQSVTVTYNSNNSTAPLQVWTSTNATGTFTYIGSLPASTSITSATLQLPLGMQYVKLVTPPVTTYNVDAITYPIYSCVAIPSTTCSPGQVSVTNQKGVLSTNTINGSVTNTSGIRGLPDGQMTTIGSSAGAMASFTFDMGNVITAGNQLSIIYSSTTTTNPLQVWVATTINGGYTNIAQLPGSTTLTTQSIVLPVDARFIMLQTMGSIYNVDAVTQTIYSCVVNLAACSSGQLSVSYPAASVSASSSGTGTVTNPSNAAGPPDGSYAILAANASVTLDMGIAVAAANSLTFTYFPSGASTPMLVEVASDIGGPYTSLASLPSGTGWSTETIVLPIGAQYVKVTNPTGAPTNAWLDAVTYNIYACYTPSVTICSAGKQSVGYFEGATTFLSSSGGTITGSSNITQVPDGAFTGIPAGASVNIGMGSSLPTGTELTITYYSGSGTGPLQLWAQPTAGGSYVYIGTFSSSTAVTTSNITLPFAAQNLQLKAASTTTAYNVDAVTYQKTVCVTPPNTKCVSGKISLMYYQGAQGLSSASPTVTNSTGISGTVDGSFAALPTNTSLVADMGNVITAGTPLFVTYNSTSTTAPLQVLVATDVSGTFTNIAQLPASGTTQTLQFTLPLDAQFIQFKTTGSAYNVDAVTFPIYTCVTKITNSCSSGQVAVSYPQGVQVVGATSGTATTPVTNTTNVKGVADGLLMSMTANSTVKLDMGAIITAGNTLTFTYNAGSSAAPLQVLVAETSSGTYTNIAQLPGSTSMQTITLALPLNARFVQLQTTSVAYNIDAITQTINSCVNSPITSCPTGKTSASYLGGVVQTPTQTAGITNGVNVKGVEDGTVTTMAASSSMELDLGSAIPAGTTLTLRYYSSAASALPLKVSVSASSGTGYLQLNSVASTSSATLQSTTFTLPVASRYVNLETSASSTYYIDALTYPIYTCVTPPSTNCASNQLSVSYQVGAEGIYEVSSTTLVTNEMNIPGTPDGNTAGLAANSYVTISMGNVITGGNTFLITYKSANTSAPLQVLVATNPTGPYTNIAQLPGSTSMTTVPLMLPVDGQYVKLQTTGTAYSIDAVTVTNYNCVNDPTNICGIGTTVASYNRGATTASGTPQNVTGPSSVTGVPDGAYAVLAANGVLIVDLGTVIAAGTTISVNYKSGDLVAPMQVSVATTLSGGYTNIGQMPASTSVVTNMLTLPVDGRYVKLETKATAFSVDAVMRPVYTCIVVESTSGIVYLDGNVNGIKNSTEQGVGGVTVKAYNASGALVGTTTTSYGNTTLNVPAGYYSFSNLTTGAPYRLEFVNLPTPYVEGIYGTNNGTSVQFVLGGTQTNDFGVYVPSTLCSVQSDSRLIFSTGTYDGATAVGSWSYLDRNVIGAATATTTITSDISPTKVGVPLGISSQRPNNLVYMSPISTNLSSVFPQAPDGSSAIYVANYNGLNGMQQYQGTKLLVKLSTLGINVGPTNTSVGGNPFGVQGLGGLDFSESGDTMYLVNMYHGSLVGVNVSEVDYNNLPGSAPTSAWEITPPVSLSNCSNGVYRPTALKQYGGKLYMGGVCDASVSGNVTDLKGVVLVYDPNSSTWGRALSYPINFCGGGRPMDATSGSLLYFCPTSWKTYSGGNTSGDAYMQPVMMDLAFADNGVMVIGTTNRLVYGSGSSNFQTGYILGAWPNGNGTYTLENAGKLGPLTTQVPPDYKIATSGPTGPGNDWFFAQRTVDNIRESTRFLYNGGLYIKPGTGELVFGSVDPVLTTSAGASYISTLTGAPLYGAQLFKGQKLSRISGVQESCDAVPPMEIGGRAWRDSDKDGIQDAGEPALVGVTVELRDASGGLVATAVTDGNGNYIFSNQEGMSNTASKQYGLPLTQLTPYKLVITTLGTNSSVSGLTLADLSPALGETASSTNTGATIANNDGFLVSGLPTISIKTGADGQVNHTYDFGFGIVGFPPVATNDIATTPQGKPVSGNVLTNDYDPEGGPLVVTTTPISNPTKGTVVLNPNGTYTYTPTPTATGEDTFCYEITDNQGLKDTACVVIDIIPTLTVENNPPVAVDDNVQTPLNTPVKIVVKANDSDPEGQPLGQPVKITEPTHGTAVVNGDGTVTYTPNTGFTGTDTFKYSICDNGVPSLCDTATVTILVVTAVAGNQPPVAVDDATLTLVNTPVSNTAATNDYDPDNNTPLTFAKVTNPSHGTVTMNSDGTYTYTPTTDYIGNDSFTYRVCDSGSPSKCDTATVTISILDGPLVKLQVKVLLQGALFGTTGGLMRDDLRTGGYLPLLEPYAALNTALGSNRYKAVNSGGETTTTGVLAANAGTGDAIVDWVFVELRDKAAPTQVVRTFSGLVQRDGDVVTATDGTSALTFKSTFGSSYFVSVKHRNHLGTMTSAAIAMKTAGTLVDFTTMDSTLLWNRTTVGTDNYDGLEQNKTVLPGKNALWAGNAVADTKLKYDGSGTDLAKILNEILVDFGATTYNYNNGFGYMQGDINMDGKVKYAGSANDVIYIQNNVLLYRLNTGKLYNYNNMLEQLP